LSFEPITLKWFLWVQPKEAKGGLGRKSQA